MRSLWSVACALAVCGLLTSASPAPAEEPPVAVPAAADADGDGLSDFDERHKYLTDPAKADTDADGVPDGDWDERRECTYSIRFLIAHLPPAAAVTDSFQDARVVSRDDDEIVLEVVAYPLATGDRDIPDERDWRSRAAPLAAWTTPNLTCDFDDAMTADLAAALKRDGIDADVLGGRSFVERVSAWAFRHAKYQDEGFTTAYTTVKDGKLDVVPGLEQVFRDRQVRKSRTHEEQFDAETRGRGMYRARIRGSCTSSAIYQQTVLRAVGIPARSTVAVPPADANSEHQLGLLREGLRPSGIRDDIVEGVEALRGMWASHTFNTVFVGGRWRRLNYSKLGEGIVSRECQGMMLRVLDYDDRCAAGTSETWGRHAGLRPASARFASANPYRLLAVSDRLGPRAKVELPPGRPPKADHAKLTIAKAAWESEPDGIVALHVVEWFTDQDGDQYKRFTDACDSEFVLRADGHPDVSATCCVGSITGPGLHCCVLQVDRAAMKEGVAYRLVPRNRDEQRKWVVAEGVTLTR